MIPSFSLCAELIYYIVILKCRQKLLLCIVVLAASCLNSVVKVTFHSVQSFYLEPKLLESIIVYVTLCPVV